MQHPGVTVVALSSGGEVLLGAASRTGPLTWHSVDLTGQLSNPSPELASLLGVASLQVRAASHAPAPLRTKQKQVRLSGQQQEELVQRYHAGALQRELAAIYGIHREAVRAIIRRSGAT